MKKLIDRGVLDAKQVYRIIPERTFGRRLAKGEALKPAEADAIGRLLRVTESAQKIFNDDGFAHKWLIFPNPALQDRIPIEMAETDAGAREVEVIPQPASPMVTLPRCVHATSGGWHPPCLRADLDGEGKQLIGGRWNSPGHGVGYTSLILSLSVLEYTMSTFLRFCGSILPR